MSTSPRRTSTPSSTRSLSPKTKSKTKAPSKTLHTLQLPSRTPFKRPSTCKTSASPLAGRHPHLKRRNATASHAISLHFQNLSSRAISERDDDQSPDNLGLSDDNTDGSGIPRSIPSSADGDALMSGMNDDYSVSPENEAEMGPVGAGARPVPEPVVEAEGEAGEAAISTSEGSEIGGVRERLESLHFEGGRG